MVRAIFMSLPGPWEGPCLVIEQYPPPDEALWVIWLRGTQAVIDEENYEVKPI